MVVASLVLSLAQGSFAQTGLNFCNLPHVYTLHGTMEAEIHSWDGFLGSGLDPDSPIPQQLDKYRAEHGYPLLMWKGKKPPSWYPVLEGPHPCGSTFIGFLKKLASEHDPLEGELVVEIDGNGKVKNRWEIPTDTEIVAIRGSEIYTPDSATSMCVPPTDPDYRSYEVWLGIQPNGRFRVAAPQADVPRVELEDCIDTKEFKASAYVRCWRYTDLETGERRHLMYQVPCS